MICPTCNVDCLEMTENNIDKYKCYLCGFEYKMMLQVTNREAKITVAFDANCEERQNIIFTLGDNVFVVEAKLSDIKLHYYHYAFCNICLPKNIRFTIDEEPMQQISEFLCLKVTQESIFED